MPNAAAISWQAAALDRAGPGTTLLQGPACLSPLDYSGAVRNHTMARRQQTDPPS
jgi:hypothetical protein